MSTQVSGTKARGYPHSVLLAVSKAYTASMSEVDERQGVEPLIGEAQLVSLLHPQRLGGAADVFGLPDAPWPVPERLPLAGDHGRHLVARPGVQRGGAAAAEHLVIRVRRNDQHALTHGSRPQRRCRRTTSSTASITSATSWSLSPGFSGRLTIRR